MKSAQFVVDVGKGIGLGHLRRSGILFDAMQEAGFRCRFFCQEPNIAAAMGYDAEIIPSDNQTFPRSDVVVCDSYIANTLDISRMRQRCRVMLILDDLGNRKIEADIVLNHNIYGGSLNYSRLTTALILTGPEHTLVDRRIVAAAEDYKKREPLNEVVLSFGGTDAGQKSANVADGLVTKLDTKLHIVVPPGMSPDEAATNLSARYPNRVSLHCAPDMATLLSTSRLYIGAAGMTALEAYVVGLDMVLSISADNQRLNGAAFSALGYTVIPSFSIEAIIEHAASLIREPYKAKHSSVDGLGAWRVIGRIERVLKSR
jgi:UDP-2,4-diacetamido-2,4,6-trideoxy-beta-L-altropyranose hydrolase